MDKPLTKLDRLEQRLDQILLSTDEEGNYLRAHEVLRVLIWELVQLTNDSTAFPAVIDGLRERRRQRIADETTEQRRQRERASEWEALNQFSGAVQAARNRDATLPDFQYV